MIASPIPPFPSEPIIIDEEWSRLKALVLDGIRSQNSKRVYAVALDDFCLWYFAEPRPPFSKAVVQEYLTSLVSRCYSTSTIRQHLAALRKLTTEAMDNGLLDPQLAAGVCRIKGPKRLGRRIGNWLSPSEAATLIESPDAGTRRGARDQAILALAVGCGLRRSEIASLTMSHLQQRENRCIIADLIGKNERVRTIPVPSFVKSILDIYLERADITWGPVFRAINKADVVNGQGLTGQAVYNIIKAYGADLALPISPHDLRRTFAKLAHRAAAPLEQIQQSLGHASVTTTEQYLGLQQDLVDAPGDRIKLPLKS